MPAAAGRIRGTVTTNRVSHPATVMRRVAKNYSRSFFKLSHFPDFLPGQIVLMEDISMSGRRRTAGHLSTKTTLRKHARETTVVQLNRSPSSLALKARALKVSRKLDGKSHPLVLDRLWRFHLEAKRFDCRTLPRFIASLPAVDTRTHPRPPNFSRRALPRRAGTTSNDLSLSAAGGQPRRDLGHHPELDRCQDRDRRADDHMHRHRGGSLKAQYPG